MSSKRYLVLLFVFMLSGIFALGCNDERKETTTKGKVNIIVDEAIAPLFSQEKDTFESLYPQAKIHFDTAQSREAMVKFFNIDSTRVIVSARPMNDEERAVAKRSNLVFGEYKVAISGIAVIVNVENKTSQMRTTQIDSVLRGLITTWNLFGWGTERLPIAVCLPDQNSGTFEVLDVKLSNGQKLAPPSHIASESPEMFRYVMEHRNSIGFAGVNWLKYYQDKVRVLELSDPAAPDSLEIKGQYFSPHQAYIYQKYYPLAVEVYMYSKADIYSVGAGFVAFVTSAPGQKIVLNSGLVPATMPIRLVEINKKGYQQ
ncbi:MAG: PstS family phosphate ABC transporter substrate-binding protein [Bacteroidota bacterium]